MDQLRQSDTKRLLDFVRDCCAIRDFEPFESFPGKLVKALSKLIPSLHTTYNELCLETNEAFNIGSKPESSSPQVSILLQRFMHEHSSLLYYVHTGDGSATRISDFQSRRQFHDTGLYAGFYRQYDVEDDLCIGVSAEPCRSITIAWHGDRQFTDRERCMADLVRPFLAQAWQNARLLSGMQSQLQLLQQSLDGAALGVISCDAEGRVRMITALARRYLANYFDCANNLDRQFPQQLLAWAQGTSVFTTVDVTGAGTSSLQGTAATAIDAAGDVAGIYIDASKIEHAFVRSASGAVTPFDASGTGSRQMATVPIGFDSAGDLVGLYNDANSRMHGFLRLATTGVITILDVAGEDTGNMEGTYPTCINGSGMIAGSYSTTIGSNSFAHGFVRGADGTIQTFDAATLPTSFSSTNPGTQVIGINASGEVSGIYIDGVGAMHGFLRDTGGKITLFEAPNAATGSEQGTIATGIDAAGDVIGFYLDANYAIHGFVRNASSGAFTTIDAPGAGTATYQGTYPDAFDAPGDVSGIYTDANNGVQGFVLPANGTIVTYDALGVCMPATRQQVGPTAAEISGSSEAMDSTKIMRAAI